MEPLPNLIRRLTILQGVPGSGKSTWAAANRPDSVICSADHFFIQDGVYKFDSTKIGQAHAECLKKCVNAMFYAEVKDIVIDNTNSTPVEVAPYMALASAYEFEATIFWIQANPRLAMERCLHGVPEATINRMHNNLRNWNGPGYWKRTAVSSQD